LSQACNHIAALLFFIQHHANDEDESTSKERSDMQLVKPCHSDNTDMPLQRIIRSSFDPRAAEHRESNDRERINILIDRVKGTMPSTGLQHFWCDGPNTMIMSLFGVV